MIKSLVMAIGTLAFSASTLAGTQYRVDYHELPARNEVVDQNYYTHMQSYTGNTPWWMCAHAAFATAFNVLRTTPANHADQLEWFHLELMKYPRYSTATNVHREAWGDDIHSIIKKRSDFDSKKVTSTSRTFIKNALHNALVSNTDQQIVALTQHRDGNGNAWGHFVVVHEVYYDPTGPGGGYVKYADPIGGISSKKVGYTDFLNGMRDAGGDGNEDSPKRYSFWKITKTGS